MLGAFAVDLLFEDGQTAAHDAILRHRLDSPAASSSIVIVDIDERALAALASALEKINATGARAVLFNVMMSDPDAKIRTATR